MHSDERTPKNGRPISKCRQAKVSEMAVNNLLAAQQVMNSINNDCDLMSFTPPLIAKNVKSTALLHGPEDIEVPIVV